MKKKHKVEEQPVKKQEKVHKCFHCQRTATHQYCGVIVCDGHGDPYITGEYPEEHCLTEEAKRRDERMEYYTGYTAAAFDYWQL